MQRKFNAVELALEWAVDMTPHMHARLKRIMEDTEDPEEAVKELTMKRGEA